MQVKRNHLDFEVHLFFDQFFLPVTGQLNFMEKPLYFEFIAHLN